MTVQAKVEINVSIQENTVRSALENGVASIAFRETLSWKDGALAGMVNEQWADIRTLAAGATETLDLAGSLSNVLGAVSFSRIKFLMLQALATNTTDLTFTRPAVNGAPLFMAAGDGIVLDPSGIFLWGTLGAAGKVITAATGDLLSVANAAGAEARYRIVLLGANA